MIPQRAAQARAAQKVCWLFWFFPFGITLWGPFFCFLLLSVFPSQLVSLSPRPAAANVPLFWSRVSDPPPFCCGWLQGGVTGCLSWSVSQWDPQLEGQFLSGFGGDGGDVSLPGTKPVTQGDVSTLVALASNLPAPFSLFLAAHSLPSPEHPSRPPSCARSCSQPEVCEDAATPSPLFLAVTFSH